jgi:hypothetical protein
MNVRINMAPAVVALAVAVFIISLLANQKRLLCLHFSLTLTLTPKQIILTNNYQLTLLSLGGTGGVG